MDWDFFSLQEDLLLKERKEFFPSILQLQKSFFTSSQTLEDYLNKTPSKEPRLNNLAVFYRNTYIGTSTNPSLLLLPVFGSFGDQYVLFISFISRSTQEILSTAHQTISKKDWQIAFKSKTLASILAGKTQLAFSEAQQNLKQPSTYSRLNLHFTNGLEFSRADQGSNMTRNLLLTGYLLKQGLQVSANFGQEAWVRLSRIFPQETPPKKFNRNCTFYWEVPVNAEEKSLHFPLSMSLTASRSESIFASPIEGSLKSNWQFSLNPQRQILLESSSAKNLLEFFQTEEKSLSPDAPKIARVYKAWVYLDKGRGWGLHLNDRMLSGTGDQAVKGHVVRFFGPEMHLTSPQGYPIHEGAILYVRKGQRKTKVGQSFSLDPTSYPTPWPPQPQK